MPYHITSSEKTNERASDTETKALLYLMNFYRNCDDIEFFAIDFFNDVTGIHRLQDEAYDLQSKGNRNINAKKIGRSLITLFKNYISDLNFKDFILFIGGIAPSALIDTNLSVFDINNFTTKAQQAIKRGLKEEGTEKSYIDKSSITDANINSFLSKVSFVIDDKSKEDYIKGIIRNENIIIDDEKEYLQKIFEEIRAKQHAKKLSKVEGICIHQISEFFHYSRHLSTGEIKLMVLSRLVNKTSLIDGIPQSFMEYACSIRENKFDRQEFIQSCQNQLFRMVCDKNNAQAYWQLFEDIYYIAKDPLNKNQSLEALLKTIPRDHILNVHHLDREAVLYFIALLKEAFEK